MARDSRVSKIVWNITNKCNFDCSFCYAKSSPLKSYGLDTESLLGIAQNLNDVGVDVISLVGGEPLIRSDISQLLDAIDSQIFVKLDTNGSLLRKKWSDAFENINAFSIGIDGNNESNEIYRRNTREVIHAVSFLVERKKSVNVPVLVSGENYKGIRTNLQFIFSLGVDRVQINKFIPSVGQKDRHLELTPLNESYVLREIINFLIDHPDYKSRVDFNGWKNELFFEKLRKPSIELPQCRCGDLSASISYDGYFVPCNVLATEWAMPVLKKIYDVPNLVNIDISEAYNNSPLFIDFRNSTGFLSTACSSCKYKFSCKHGCRGYAMLAGGDIYSHITTCSL